jgi:hypothetical protein
MILLMSTIWAGVEITNFEGYAENARIVIQWSTSSEDDIVGFEIQRSTDGDTFFEIGYLHAQGQGSGYTFVDDSIIAKVSGRDYYYRLKIKDIMGNVELSKMITIPSNISSVNHTWGSLKALFK